MAAAMATWPSTSKATLRGADRQWRFATGLVLPLGLAAWTLSLLVLLGARWRATTRPGTAYDPASRQFTVPGSALPLLTMLAVFLLKYGIGVELAMQPALRHDAFFALSTAAGYGLIKLPTD